MASAAESAPEVCRYYTTPSGCWFGKKCRFVHLGEDKTSTSDKKLCRFFSSVNGCRYGNRCRFLHEGGSGAVVDRSGSDGEKCPDSSTTDQSDNSLEQSSQSISDVSNAETSPLDVHQPDTDNLKVIHSDSCDSPDGDTEEKKEPKDLYSCGECKKVFKGKDAYNEILRHHSEMICKMEKSHMVFLGTNQWFSRYVTCGACGKDFARARDLLRHLIDKSKTVKNSKDQELHASLLEEVSRAFADRDVGLSTPAESHEELMIYLTSYVGFEDNSDSDSSDVGMRMGLYMLSHAQHLQRNSMSSNYEDELEERMENFGFTSDEVNELLSQGVKPWDDCAHNVLAVLHGEYDDFY